MRNRNSLRTLGLLLVGLALAAVNVSAGGEDEAAATGRLPSACSTPRVWRGPTTRS